VNPRPRRPLDSRSSRRRL